MNFSLPVTWGAPEPEDRHAMPMIDPKDRDLVSIVKAASALDAREKALVLVLIQTISAWGGLADHKTAS